MKLQNHIAIGLMAFGVSANSAEKAANKYVNVMLSHICSSILSHGMKNDQLSLPYEEMRIKMGKLTIDNKQEWILLFIQKQANLRLVNIEFRGNIGVNTRVSINEQLEEQIMEELINVAAETTPAKMLELDKNKNVRIACNAVTLASYIRKTQNTYDTTPRDLGCRPYLRRIWNNLLIAKHLMGAMQQDDQGYYLEEHWVEYDSGRMYGQGLSLQRVPKEVRHAALGVTYRYDFKASAYALLTGLATQIDPALKVGDLTDYVRNRAAIRESIAREIGSREDLVKTVFSAIGFGARTANNPYASVRSVLGKEAYDKLMLNKQFQNIKKSFDEVMNVIDAHYGNDFELCGIKYNHIDPRTGEKRNKAQKLAWIYQVLETEAASRFAVDAADRGFQYVLWVHDCLYFKDQINHDTVNDIIQVMKSSFPFINVDRERIVPIQDSVGMDNLYSEVEQMARDHAAFIRSEEKSARTRVQEHPQEHAPEPYQASISAQDIVGYVQDRELLDSVTAE